MKKTILAILLAAALMLSLAGCGSESSSSSSGSYQFSDIQTVTAPPLGSTEIDAPDSGFSEIETVTAPELGTTEIDAPDYGFSEIETITAPELESIILEMPDYDFGDIETILPAENLTMELHIPDYQFSDITVENVSLSIPVIDYEVSFSKIASPYTDTYTVPDLQIDVPDFDDPKVEGAFVSVASNLSATDQQRLSELDKPQVAQVMSVQLSITNMLLNAFKSAGLTVAIDPLTGSIPIDASLLYDTNEYELKEEGKAALKAVFSVYYYVLSRPEFRGAIDSIVIEGHTDTNGGYEFNQELSEKRARAVYDYLLSCGFEDSDFLRSILTTVGRSYDDPVYAADGTVDMAGSRRVELHFVPNLDL